MDSKVKRTAKDFGLVEGDKVKFITGPREGLEATLSFDDGTSWPYFKVTKEVSGLSEGDELPVYLTTTEGEVSFVRDIPEGFTRNEGKAPEVEEGGLVDVLYNDGSLVLGLDVAGGKSGVAENTGMEYYAADWTLFGGKTQIKAYRLAVQEPAKLPTLESVLAEFKNDLNAANDKIAAITLELGNAVSEKEALLERVQKLGFQCIGEAQTTVEQTAEGVNLRVGSILKAVTPEDTDEHTAGSAYKVLEIDSHGYHKYKLESNDGLGWWIREDECQNYNVLSR